MFMSEKDFQNLIERHPHLVKSQIELPPKQNKYRNIKLYEYSDGYVSENKKLTCHGNVIHVFDSTKEYNRWMELKLLERAGEISNLERQKSLIIQDAFTYQSLQGKHKISPITYKADFCYFYKNKLFVEDVKPFDDDTGKYHLTKDFSLKWKLLMFKYPDYEFVIF